MAEAAKRERVARGWQNLVVVVASPLAVLAVGACSTAVAPPSEAVQRSASAVVAPPTPRLLFEFTAVADRARGTLTITPRAGSTLALQTTEVRAAPGARGAPNTVALTSAKVATVTAGCAGVDTLEGDVTMRSFYKTALVETFVQITEVSPSGFEPCPLANGGAAGPAPLGIDANQHGSYRYGTLPPSGTATVRWKFQLPSSGKLTFSGRVYETSRPIAAVDVDPPGRPRPQDHALGSFATSADGRFVAFVSNAALVGPDPADTLGDAGPPGDGQVVESDATPGQEANGSDGDANAADAGEAEGDASGPGGADAGAADGSGDDDAVAPDAGDLDGGDGDAANLDAGDTDADDDDAGTPQDAGPPSRLQVFLRDTLLGTTRLISARAGTMDVPSGGDSWRPSVSDDGTVVAFLSTGRDLTATAPSKRSTTRAYVWRNGVVTSQSVTEYGAPLAGNVETLRVSANGEYLVYVGRPTGSTRVLYWASLLDARRRRVNIGWLTRAPTMGAIGKGLSVSDDGALVLFASDAPDLVSADTNGVSDVFLANMAPVTSSNPALPPMSVQRISVSDSGAEGNGPSTVADWGGALAGNSFVTFETLATNLDSGPTPAAFVRDLAQGVTRRVSLTASGSPARAVAPSISDDGRMVAFTAPDDVFPGDSNGLGDIVVHDRWTGQSSVVSRSRDGVQADAPLVGGAVLSRNGQRVVFASRATTLVPGAPAGASIYQVNLR